MLVGRTRVLVYVYKFRQISELKFNSCANTMAPYDFSVFTNDPTPVLYASLMIVRKVEDVQVLEVKPLNLLHVYCLHRTQSTERADDKYPFEYSI